MIFVDRLRKHRQYSALHQYDFVDLHCQPDAPVLDQFSATRLRVCSLSRNETNIAYNAYQSDNSGSYHICGTCSNAERYNGKVLNSKTKYYRRGTVIVVNGISIGLVKAIGNSTLLSWRSIRGNDGWLTIFGGIYMIPHSLYDSLPSWVHIDDRKQEWELVETRMLGLLPVRLADNIRQGFFSSLIDCLQTERELFDRAMQLR